MTLIEGLGISLKGYKVVKGIRQVPAITKRKVVKKETHPVYIQRCRFFHKRLGLLTRRTQQEHQHQPHSCQR